jgi:hypothetical protein
MVDAGCLPPLGPAPMFMVRFIGITTRNMSVQLFYQAMCSFPCYFGSNIVHLIYVSSAVMHEASSTAVTVVMLSLMVEDDAPYNLGCESILICSVKKTN